MNITTEKFKEATGADPVDDDLERCNCKLSGLPGHFMCGWNNIRNMPNFIPGESKAKKVTRKQS